MEKVKREKTESSVKEERVEYRLEEVFRKREERERGRIEERKGEV